MFPGTEQPRLTDFALIIALAMNVISKGDLFADLLG